MMLVIFCLLKNSMLRSRNINSWCSCVMNAFSIKKEQCDKHSWPQIWHQTCTHEMADTLKFKRHDLHAHDNIHKCIINNLPCISYLLKQWFLTFFVPTTCKHAGFEVMVICVLAINELMRHILCDQSNFNWCKTKVIKLCVSLCIVSMVCILPALPKTSSRIKCAFWKQASIRERCWILEVYTNKPWT